MKYVIVGTGAIGGYFGAKLQQAGHEVIFVARGESLRVLREKGLILRHQDREIRLCPIHATDDMTSIGPVDYAFICVKAWQVEDVAPKLSSLQRRHTRFLTLQNGVEAAHVVSKYVGPEQTLATDFETCL